jgi:hypothetical protein
VSAIQTPNAGVQLPRWGVPAPYSSARPDWHMAPPLPSHRLANCVEPHWPRHWLTSMQLKAREACFEATARHACALYRMQRYTTGRTSTTAAHWCRMEHWEPRCLPACNPAQPRPATATAPSLCVVDGEWPI